MEKKCLKKLDEKPISNYGIGEKLVSLTSSKPQSGFPHYRRGGLLKLFRMRPFGWEDRGKCTKKKINNEKDWTIWDYWYYSICFNCYFKTHIGQENGYSFIFCPKCLTKIKE